MSQLRDALLKSFTPRMAVKLDTLGKYERDHLQVLELLKKALIGKYNIYVDTDKETIYIGMKR